MRVCTNFHQQNCICKCGECNANILVLVSQMQISRSTAAADDHTSVVVATKSFPRLQFPERFLGRPSLSRHVRVFVCFEAGGHSSKNPPIFSANATTSIGSLPVPVSKDCLRILLSSSISGMATNGTPKGGPAASAPPLLWQRRCWSWVCSPGGGRQSRRWMRQQPLLS